MIELCGPQQITTEAQTASHAAQLLLRTGVTMTKYAQAEESDQFHDVCFWYDVAQQTLCWQGTGMFKSAKSIPLTEGMARGRVDVYVSAARLVGVLLGESMSDVCLCCCVCGWGCAHVFVCMCLVELPLCVFDSVRVVVGPCVSCIS